MTVQRSRTKNVYIDIPVIVSLSFKKKKWTPS